MLDKQTFVNQIEVTEDNVVQVRFVVRILENDVAISESFHRLSFNKGDDISEQDAKVQAVCNAVWGE
jgi:hypothetical protein